MKIIVDQTEIDIDPNWSCGITPVTRNMNGIIQHLYKDIKLTYPEYSFEYYWKELRTDW